STGAVVPGARVTLLRIATNERRETVTNPSGGYSFPLIEIGEYSIKAEAQGFKPMEKTGVAVQLQQRARVNFELSVGDTREAVEEFKVQTSSYSAEYGQSSGAVVQIAMKGGTNQFHGTMFEFLRNDKLAAKDYFLNFQLPPGANPLPANRLRRNQFGVFLSGP